MWYYIAIMLRLYLSATFQEPAHVFDFAGLLLLLTRLPVKSTMYRQADDYWFLASI